MHARFEQLERRRSEIIEFGEGEVEGGGEADNLKRGVTTATHDRSIVRTDAPRHARLRGALLDTDAERHSLAPRDASASIAPAAPEDTHASSEIDSARRSMPA